MGIKIRKKGRPKKPVKKKGSSRKARKEILEKISRGRPEEKDDWADISDQFKPPTKKHNGVFQVVTRTHPALGHRVWAVDVLRYGSGVSGVPISRQKGKGHYQLYLNVEVIDSPEGLGLLIDWLTANKAALVRHAQKTVAAKDRRSKG